MPNKQLVVVNADLLYIVKINFISTSLVVIKSCC